MKKFLKKLFVDDVPTGDSASEVEVNFTAAILFYELIAADHEISADELLALKTTLVETYDIEANAFTDTLDRASIESKEAISLQRFTRNLCENWTREQRLQFVENMWLIALSDDHLDAHERHLIRKVSGLLYINDKEIVVAKEKAKTRLANR